jgi:hypothetical protein
MREIDIDKDCSYEGGEYKDLRCVIQKGVDSESSDTCMECRYLKITLPRKEILHVASS